MDDASQMGTEKEIFFDNRAAEKPKKLFHASPNKNIDIFEPRAERVRDPGEGPVVFGTPDKSYASMFLVRLDDTCTSKGKFNNGSWICVIGDIQKYLSLDHGGAIYTLASETFDTDPQRNMHEIDWVSRVPVHPENKEVFDSGLEAMISLGVSVYVMSKDEFEIFNQLKLQKQFKEAIDMLKTIKPETLDTITRYSELGVNTN